MRSVIIADVSGYAYQPDLFEFPDARFRNPRSPTPAELWASGRVNVALPEPNDYTPMVALDNPTFTEIEEGRTRTLVLPMRDRYATIFRCTPFAIRLRIGFSGWWMTWEVAAFRRFPDSFEIDLGLRLS